MSEIFSEGRELADDYRVPSMRNEAPASDPTIVPAPALPVISITKITEISFRLNSDVDVSLWDYIIQTADDPPAWTELRHGAGATDGDVLSYDGSPGFVRLRLIKGTSVVDSNQITMTGSAPILTAPTLLFDPESENWLASIDKATQPTEPSDWEFALSGSIGWLITTPTDPELSADLDSPESSRPLDSDNWKAALSEVFFLGMARFKSGGVWSAWSSVAAI